MRIFSTHIWDLWSGRKERAPRLFKVSCPDVGQRGKKGMRLKDVSNQNNRKVNQSRYHKRCLE